MALGVVQHDEPRAGDLDVLVAASGTPVTAQGLSSYPVARTDVALVVDAGVPAAEVEAALRAGAGEDLETVALFDVYDGDQIGEGQVSLAYRLTLRAPDRTLTTGEVSGLRDKAVASAVNRARG